MRQIYLAVALCALCLPVFGQSLASNQVRINGKTFTIGTNTYNSDYNVIFNQWYKGHKSAEEAKQGEDLSWVTDFTRTYTLNFSEGTLAIGGATVGGVKVIVFSMGGSRANRYGGIGLLNMRQWLVYDSGTGLLIGAQLYIQAYNVYLSVNPEFFDMQAFLFPLKVDKINTPVSSFDTGRGLISYKNVYEYSTDSSVTNGVGVCIYKVNSAVAKQLKDADDFARTMKKDIPSLLGTLTQEPAPQSAPRQAVMPNATHQLTADLNVFAEQDGGSPVVASLKKGNPVQVLEYGEYADWNGITAKWAKIKTGDGKTGWLFSGYLEELRK
jgi:hypothetical protein